MSFLSQIQSQYQVKPKEADATSPTLKSTASVKYYHGTDKTFTMFDTNKNFIYFTNSVKYAKNYGSNIIPVYFDLNQFNLFEFDTQDIDNYFSLNEFCNDLRTIDRIVAEYFFNHSGDTYDADTENEGWYYMDTLNFHKALKVSNYDGFKAEEKSYDIIALFPSIANQILPKRPIK